jgi:hypothetical protein
VSQDLTNYSSWIAYDIPDSVFAAKLPAVDSSTHFPAMSELLSSSFGPYLWAQSIQAPPYENWEGTTRSQRGTTITRGRIEAGEAEHTEVVLAEWDGYVEVVKPKYFVARMRGLKGDGVAGKEEEAEIPISDVDPDDLSLLVIGGFFRLLISYETRRGGMRRRFTSVAFRRLPTYTQREIDDAEREAQKILGDFVLAGPGESSVA